MDPVLTARGLSKSFPGVVALDGVQLDVFPGRVHVLMGENGAGKSTLMKILAGLLQPDAGEVRFKGRALRLRSPHHALRSGIAMIHQELMPFPALSVAENIFMGHEPRNWLGLLSRRAMHRMAAALLDRLEIPLAPDARMGELSIAEMQVVEIAKALAHEAELVIMDEPTSAISGREVERLFEVIAGLKARGVAVIYISHKLDEVYRIGDDVTVLRDGRFIDARPLREVTRDALIAMMVGRELGERDQEPKPAPGEVVLSVRGLARRGAFENVSFDLRRGEILGIAGLMGAGRTEVAHALYGLAPADAGEIRLRDRPVRIRSPRAAIRRGIALVAEDRKRHGLVLPMSVGHNLTLSTLSSYCIGPLVNRLAENRAVQRAIRDYAIRTPSPRQRVGNLSGGNQQKIVLGKALLAKPSVLILDEPTRGIDVAAKQEMHDAIARLAAQGMAVLLVSSELPEILALCHRVLVMRTGLVATELRGAQMNQRSIMHFAMPA